MSDREATAQQTDPLGALNQRPITLVIGIFAVALALGRTIFSHDPGTVLPLAVLAIVFVAIAAAVVVVSSSPLRAPFTRASFVVILVSGILGLVAESASAYGHDVMIRDDWGSAALGLLLLACAPYRPGRELVVGTVAAAVAVAAVVVVEAPFFSTRVPTIVFVGVGVTPVLALGVGSAVYALTFVTLVQQWLSRAAVLTRESAQEMRPGIARSVQQDRVTGLNRDVVPFFTDLVERGEVTDDDRARAGQVATLIRQRIVAESDRSWLEQILLDLCPNGQAGTVVDRADLASHMTGDQRTAVRAVIQAMASDQSARTPSLGIVLHDDHPLVRALIRIESTSADVAVRQRYAPYFAVLRILFHDLQVDVNGSFLTLRFSYDQH
ncbi:hypothetical protein GCM10025867_38920 [Frondihabitans sucicola]|uniref:FUSC family protein n=1 Tax=Frondihabitans sucicola TaxID=1268041 RepID=A0ABM8GT90_9MICO|nr:hypothetical protein [Frondihabitans sucicola]BDZ51651.1 hypothetical protein GCM10025867_38920 [Frondihabitans sucicola]